MSDKTTKIKRHIFTHEEDQMIIDLHNKYGDNSWHLIQKALGLKDVRSARERFKTYLNKNSDPFTFEEDLIILEKYRIFGSKWTLIATFLKNRSDIQIRNRFRQITSSKHPYVPNCYRKAKCTRMAKLSSSFTPTTSPSPVSSPGIDIPLFETFTDTTGDNWNNCDDLFSTFYDGDSIMA